MSFLDGPGPIGLTLMALASGAILTALAVKQDHLNGQVATWKDATVTAVQPAQIDRSTGMICSGVAPYISCSNDVDVRTASVVVTSTGRYLVEGTWPGLAGEKVQLRTMRGGRVNLCRADGECAIVQR